MKTLIISGGSTGIGKATVDRFNQAGYFTYNLDKHPPQKKTPHSEYIPCDIANVDDIHTCIQAISESKLSVDALVCNAGIHFSANLLGTTVKDYDHVLDINFRGAFFLTQAVLPLMLPQKKGAIVYVGSDQTLIARPNSAIYGASKAALASLSRTTAIDYAKEGIRANLVAPGIIDTPLYQRAITKYCENTGIDPALAHSLEAKEQPIGRIGQPEEVANLIYFLCSDEASFITGAIYPIDGGYTAR